MGLKQIREVSESLPLYTVCATDAALLSGEQQVPLTSAFYAARLGGVANRAELVAGLQAQRHIHVTDAVLHKLAGVKDSEGEMRSY